MRPIDYTKTRPVFAIIKTNTYWDTDGKYNGTIKEYYRITGGSDNRYSCLDDLRKDLRQLKDIHTYNHKDTDEIAEHYKLWEHLILKDTSNELEIKSISKTDKRIEIINYKIIKLNIIGIEEVK